LSEMQCSVYVERLMIGLEVLPLAPEKSVCAGARPAVRSSPLEPVTVQRFAFFTFQKTCVVLPDRRSDGRTSSSPEASEDPEAGVGTMVNDSKTGPSGGMHRFPDFM
jgi:hypothetical protein